MKKIFIIAVFISLMLPTAVGADVISYHEAWAFLYDFPLSLNGGVLAVSQPYRLATGNAPVLSVGSWTLTLLDGKGRLLAQHEFDPAALAVAGNFDLLVPYFDNGTTARFSDASGRQALEIDLRGSRVCNDDGVCASGYGENRDTCPSDCGPAAASSVQVRTAAIAQQVSVGKQLGVWLMRLALGAAGIMLLVGVAHVLDNRRAS